MSEALDPNSEVESVGETVPYYPPSAYASGQRRIIALLIDLFITGALFSGPFTTVAWFMTPLEVKQMETSNKKQRLEKQQLMREAVGDWYVPLIWVGVGLMAVYQILLRKSRLGTLGYLVTGIKLVGPDGQSPDWRTYGKRVLICLLEVFSIGLVYIACFMTKKHQAFHDQLVSTWLIRRNAKPDGPGQIVYNTRLLGLYPVMMVDVEPVTTDEEDASADD